MRVGLIHYGLDRRLGGIGRYSEFLLEALRARQLSITVLGAGRAGEHSGSVSLPGARLLPGLMTFGQLGIGRAIRHHRLDLVHDPLGVAPLMLAGSGRVTTIHDVVPYTCPETSAQLDRLIYHFWLPIIVRRIDAIITASQQSKADIVKHLAIAEEKVTIIPLAAGRRYRPMPDNEIYPTLARYGLDFPYILYVGSLTPRKNLPRLLEAYWQLRQWSAERHLVIVGARKSRSSPVFTTVQQLGLREVVHFTGFAEEEDLPSLYNGADLFVFPSLYEGFGLPVLEAMACGTPVVTSNTTSLPEVAGDAALLVDPYNVEGIAAAMRCVLEDQHLARVLRARGLARAAEFSWERTARETVKVYQKVLRCSDQ